MEIAELRRRFNGSSSELLDLLEFTRTPRASVLRDLLEQGRAEVTVQPVVAETPAARDVDQIGEEGQTTAQPTVTEAARTTLADLRPVPGEELPPRLGVFSIETEQLIALVPTSLYGEVQPILDTGVPTTGTLQGDTLELVLASETAD
jgi:hypothetical protein